MHVVICGGGVIGTACAYELSRRDVHVTLIERWKIAGAASGKSGGFLARNWCDGTPVAALAQRSFDLHRIWAERLGNPYGYRPVDTFSAALGPRRRAAAPATCGMADWLAPEAGDRSRLGDRSTTAALDPAAFTNALMEAAIAGGASLRVATVTGVAGGGDGDVQVTLDNGEKIAADAAILALGPWSLLAAAWVPLAPVYGLKGHSIIYRPDRALPAEAVFAEMEADGDVHTPEIVARADGTVYVCGLAGRGGLPLDPARVLPEADGSELLHEMSARLVPHLATAQIVVKQACFRPVTADGMPLIGPIADHPGIHVATGHSVWGMLNAPGTAEALADTLLDGAAKEISLAPFAPDRLAPLDPGQLDFKAG